MSTANMLQLSPPIPVKTPLGDGWALIVIDYGPQWNTCWAVQLHETGELKHFDSNDIRFPKNHTYNTPRAAVKGFKIDGGTPGREAGESALSSHVAGYVPQERSGVNGVHERNGHGRGV